MRVRMDRTVLMVTHKLPAMRLVSNSQQLAYPLLNPLDADMDGCCSVP